MIKTLPLAKILNKQSIIIFLLTVTFLLFQQIYSRIKNNTTVIIVINNIKITFFNKKKYIKKNRL